MPSHFICHIPHSRCAEDFIALTAGALGATRAPSLTAVALGHISHASFLTAVALGIDFEMDFNLDDLMGADTEEAPQRSSKRRYTGSEFVDGESGGGESALSKATAALASSTAKATLALLQANGENEAAISLVALFGEKVKLIVASGKANANCDTATAGKQKRPRPWCPLALESQGYTSGHGV